MFLQFETKEDFVRWAQENLLSPHEVANLLGVSLQAVHQSVKNGKLTPLKKEPRFSLFLKEDILNRKKELEMLRSKYRPFEAIIDGYRVFANEYSPGKWEYHIYGVGLGTAAARRSEETYDSMEEALEAGIQTVKRK
ncbi:MerR family transcriptional regulator [Effusibacillus pohliae]|uniref:helix-turn-helix domain-containing protein n=1 Tax=Effusibacillus pohliae TaxID=232270 RepID=UPI00036793A5|nr:helix-turn-helix domain-containing protein [Effusibacillus pohliae]